MKRTVNDIFNGLKAIFKNLPKNTLENIKQSLKSAGMNDREIEQKIQEIRNELEITATEMATQWKNFFINTFAGYIKKDGNYYDISDSSNIKVSVIEDSIKLTLDIPVKQVNNDYIMTTEDAVILINSVINTNTHIILPNTEQSKGKYFVIKNIGYGTVVISPSSGTIDGSNNVNLNSVNSFVGLISDGTNWFIINRSS